MALIDGESPNKDRGNGLVAWEFASHSVRQTMQGDGERAKRVVAEHSACGRVDEDVGHSHGAALVLPGVLTEIAVKCLDAAGEGGSVVVSAEQLEAVVTGSHVLPTGRRPVLAGCGAQPLVRGRRLLERH